MTTAQDIMSYLSNQTDLTVKWYGNDEQLDNEVHHLQTDIDALPGDLAWISFKQSNIRTDAIEKFQGSLLITPLGINIGTYPVIGCSKPKLAFILTVNHFFFDRAEIKWPDEGRTIANDAIIGNNVSLASGVIIGSRVVIEENVEVGPNTVIANTHIHKNVKIGANCSIGLSGFGYDADEDGKYWRFPHTGEVIIHEDTEIGSNTCIDRGSIGDTLIGRGVKIDNLVHVAHNVEIGENSLIIANAMLGGSVIIGANGWVAPSVSIMNQTAIGNSSVIGLGAVVLKDVEDHSVMVGNPAKLLRKNK